MGDIRVEMQYGVSPERVWRTLTEPGLIAKWLMPNDFRPELGAEFAFRARPMGNWDGVAHCKVLEIEPHRKLAYSFKSNVIDTVVTFELEPRDGGTFLRFSHTGFTGKGDFMARLFMGMGWRSKLRKVVPKLAAAL